MMGWKVGNERYAGTIRVKKMFGSKGLVTIVLGWKVRPPVDGTRFRNPVKNRLDEGDVKSTKDMGWRGLNAVLSEKGTHGN